MVRLFSYAYTEKLYNLYFNDQIQILFHIAQGSQTCTNRFIFVKESWLVSSTWALTNVLSCEIWLRNYFSLKFEVLTWRKTADILILYFTSIFFPCRIEKPATAAFEK